MSAIIHDPYRVDVLGSLGKDGVRRYKTRCKILVDSHLNSETIYLVDDVLSVQTSKTIKGAGQATFILTPSENYLNIIFPNDYINIYFDIGDGSGWTRTFFGLVDRVEEEYMVGKEGRPKTTYKVVCSDFHKVFERTMVYFNPHLALREEFENYDFAKANVAGLSLMTKGILAGGSPPDIIKNLILQMMGFGTQFQLPPSYAPGSVQKRLRERRQEDVTGRLSQEAVKELSSVGNNYLRLKEEIRQRVTNTVGEFGKLSSIEDVRTNVAKELGIQLRTGKEKITTEAQLIEEATDQKLRDLTKSRENVRGLSGTISSDIERNQAILESTVSEDSYIIDIVDLDTFVERRAIDGYLFGQPVWQKQGPLISILRSFSNEPINELFFDLRPLSSSGSDNDVAIRPLEGEYAIIADDKKGNRDEDDSEAGVTYIPSVVMREYPFSTIEGLDLSEVELQVKGEDGENAKVGKLWFGDIFSRDPNTPGRKIVEIPNINIDDLGREAAESDETKEVKGQPTALGYKHIDVAVVSEEEIIKSTLGRSDADHFNLFEFYSDAVLGTDKRFYMKDILPVITPIHILRHGLRVRTVTTRAARFSIEAVAKSKTQSKAEPETADKSNKTDNAVDDLAEFTGTLISPVDSNQEIIFRNSQQSDWGYRPKPRPGRTDGIQAWVFHQGIDISKRPGSPSTAAIPIRAVADGWIVWAAPDGLFTGYGNVVVIKHKFPNIKGFRYSVYSHLDSISSAFSYMKGAIPNASRAMRRFFAAKGEAPGIGRGVQKPIPVRQGDVIGFMGNTGTGYAPGFGLHLHFEMCRRWPPKDDSVTPRIPFEGTPPELFNPQDGPTPAIPSGFDPTGHNTDQMVSAGQRSCDPVRFYSAYGLDLIELINGGTPTGDEGENEPDDRDNGNGTQEELVNSPISDVQEETGTQLLEEQVPVASRGTVDSTNTRTQILRWALLQDHWYQHNLEYLSGRIDMRGAPEIRVGYRLDVKERDMSFYVEGVNHTWTYPNSMKTNLQVSRGQPNNPYPIYVYPYFTDLGSTTEQRRTGRSRLGTYFLTPDPIAIRRSLFLRGNATKEAGLFRNNNFISVAAVEGNAIDSLDAIEYETDTRVAEKYNEFVAPAGARVDLNDTGLQDNEAARDNTGTDSVTNTDASAQPKRSR